MECVTINEKVVNVLKQANINIQLNNIEVGKITKDEKINEIMDNDFNTPNLITYLLDLVKELNMALRNNTEISHLYDKINLVNYILGLEYDLKKLSEEEKDIYRSWIDARNNKDYELADKYREQLQSLNIL